MMRKLVFLLAVLTLASTAYAATPYTGPWSITWDFETGLQGWVLGKAGTVDGKWIAPGEELPLPDGGNSGYTSGSVYLPDKSFAKLDVSALGLAGKRSVGKPFVFEAEIYIPNLSPITFWKWAYPSNYITSAGIGVIDTGDNKEMYVEGSVSESSNRFTYVARDSNWDNTNRYATYWLPEELGTVPKSLWWDKKIILQVDYGYTTDGKWNAWVYQPWDSPVGGAGWHQINIGQDDRDVHPTDMFEQLRLGGAYSWTQAQFDNARLVYVPEPGSLLALGAGLAGLLGAVRRRR